jgi:hypothetical protein
MRNLRVDNRFLLLLFVLMFTVVEVSDFLVPYRAQGFGTESLLIYYSAFSIVSLALVISCFIRFSIKVHLPSVAAVERITDVVILLSLTALLLVVYDRVFIQGVDYSKGIAHAREMWRALATEREGASSLFNVVGNLFFPFVFFSVGYCVLFFESAVKLRKNFYLSIILVFVFSVVTGGRELLLVLFGVFLSSLALRFAVGLPVLAKVMKKDFLTVFCMAFFFAVYVGYLRSQSYDFGMDEYARSLATRLGAAGKKTDGLSTYTPDAVLPVLIYLAHVKWEFINAIAHGGGEGLSTFRQVFKMLLDYLYLSFDWVDYKSPSYSPNWISLVGSIYYDLGWIGIFLYSLVLVFSPCIFLILFSVKEFNRAGFSMSMYLFFCAIIIFSPFAFLFEVVQFIYFLVFVAVVFFASFIPVKRCCNNEVL